MSKVVLRLLLISITGRRSGRLSSRSWCHRGRDVTASFSQSDVSIFLRCSQEIQPHNSSTKLLPRYLCEHPNSSDLFTGCCYRTNRCLCIFSLLTFLLQTEKTRRRPAAVPVPVSVLAAPCSPSGEVSLIWTECFLTHHFALPFAYKAFMLGSLKYTIRPVSAPPFTVVQLLCAPSTAHIKLQRTQRPLHSGEKHFNQERQMILVLGFHS